MECTLMLLSPHTFPDNQQRRGADTFNNEVFAEGKAGTITTAAGDGAGSDIT